MTATPAGATRRAAIVVNPTKLPDGDPRGEIVGTFTGAGWAEPLWLETTEEDPGFGATKQALDAGVDIVCVLGGDGTVRVVGSGLVGSGVPLGILPGGTGNLLARQLDMPVDSLDAALDTLLHGTDRPIDVANAVLTRANGEKEQHHFLVMSGVGFDAKIMSDAPEELKKRVGWMAYTVSGLKNIAGKRVRSRLRFDGGEPRYRRMRSVIVANCGRLQAGMELAPDAAVDDGLLDTVILSPKGLVGWAGLLVAVATKQHKGHRMIEHQQSRRIVVDVLAPISAELDGDPMGFVTRFAAEVLPGALKVRVAKA